MISCRFEAILPLIISLTVLVKGQNILQHMYRETGNPLVNFCQNGDFIDSSVADCCSAGISTYDSEKDRCWCQKVVENQCNPCKHGCFQFVCGEHETNSCCIIVSQFGFKECRCQYWPIDLASNPHHTQTASLSIEPATTTNTQPVATTTTFIATKTSRSITNNFPTHYTSNYSLSLVLATITVSLILGLMIMFHLRHCPYRHKHKGQLQYYNLDNNKIELLDDQNIQEKLNSGITPEANEGYNIMKKCHTKLINIFSLNIQEVTAVLFANNFISEDINDKTLLLSYTPPEKATLLVNAVTKRIKTAPEYFQKLMNILSETSLHQDIMRIFGDVHLGEQVHSDSVIMVIIIGMHYYHCLGDKYCP